MLSPQYLEHISDSILELFLTAELDIIADIARRLNMVGEVTSTAEWQMLKLKEMNAVYEYVYERLSSLTGKTNDELNAIFSEAGTKALKTDDSIYKAVNLSPSAIKSNPHLQQIIFEGIRQTKGLFRNLTATTARTASRQFEICLDRAYMQVKSGAFSADSAIRSAINDLANQGISSIVYPSGHTDSIEVAVRRAVVTGINQSALKLQEARADEMGCDLVETTAHGGARPTHAVWQGKVFSRSGKSRNYPPLSETGYGTGAGLGGWNCRHSFYPFFEGISVRNYTDEELDEINGRTVTYNGQEMSLYEATQKQRSIERNIRKYKREAAGLEAVDMDSSGAKAKVRQWQGVQKDFLNQTGLKRDYSREQIPKIMAKPLDSGGGSGIMKVGSENVFISAIEQPIEQQHTGKGNPNAILLFDTQLNNRQQKLLEQLPDFDSRAIVPKRSVNMADLSALTAKTGNEYAMFTKGNERLIIRGNSTKVNIGLEDAELLASQGYKWSGHTHPGADFFCLEASDGDYQVFRCFVQRSMVIYNSKGQYRKFEKE